MKWTSFAGLLGIAALLILLAILFQGLGAKAESSAPSRPNIVLIIGDDMTWNDSSAYGSPNISTPNIDRLASEGIKFTRAYQSTAMCAVTRQQLYTGLDPVRSGAYPQHSWTDKGIKSVFTYLKAIGYRVGLTGKTHIGPPENFPFDFMGEMGGDSGLNENLPPVDFKAFEEFVRKDPSQPFFTVIASHRPHAPWVQGDPSKFDPAELTIPKYLADTPGMRQTMVHYLAAVGALDDEVGTVMDILKRTGADKNTLVLFTSEQGSSFPFAKWTLYDAGVHTEIIARWPGHIRPGSSTNAMISYEDVTPTFIEAAGGTSPADLDGRSFLSVLTGKAQKHRDYVYGIHTNFGIIGGEPYPIRSVSDGRYVLIRNLMSDKPYRNVLNNTQAGGAMIKDWEAAGRAGNAWAAERVAAYNRRPREELYDLTTDPDELKNRAGDPALAATKARLAAELDRWMKQQGDTGVPLELAAFRHINPAIVRWINKNYPDAARNPDGTPLKVN